MNIKTSIYATFLCAFAVLECSDTDLEQLRTELSEATNQLKTLGEQVQKQEALYIQAQARFFELRNRILEERKIAHATKDSKKSDEELLSEITTELKIFWATYRDSEPTKKCISQEKFLGDFFDHVLLKFYLIKAATEYILLEDLISKWEECDRRKTLLSNSFTSKSQ